MSKATHPDALGRVLKRIYERLTSHYGPTHWWPGDSPFEVAVGAILTQNTAWTNVEKAIANLKAAKLLAPKRLLDAPDPILHDALRPSGYFRVKTVRLRSFCAYLVRRYRGRMQHMAAQPLESLRPELLDVAGIGPETADDILLYACEKPVFVVDAYTRRILSRHELCDPKIPYEELRALFERHIEPRVPIYKEYHGLIVYTGKDFCRRQPKCQACPLCGIVKND